MKTWMTSWKLLSLLKCSLIIKNEVKEQEERFGGMLIGRLGGNLLGSMLTGKGVIRASKGTIKVGERANRAG